MFVFSLFAFNRLKTHLDLFSILPGFEFFGGRRSGRLPWRNVATLSSYTPNDGRLHVHRLQRRTARRQQASSPQRQL